MNDKAYIIPGLGDAGDLAFGKRLEWIFSYIFFDLDRTLWDFDFNSHESLIERSVKSAI